MLKRRLRGGKHLWMPCQAQVVVRAEHDHAATINDRLWSIVHFDRLEEGIQAGGPGLIGELKVGDPLEDVGRLRVALTPIHLVHAKAGGLGESGQ